MLTAVLLTLPLVACAQSDSGLSTGYVVERRVGPVHLAGTGIRMIVSVAHGYPCENQ